MSENIKNGASSAEDAPCIDKYVVIVAGGEGLRAGGGIPKQFRMLGGEPVLWKSVKSFYKEDNKVKIIIVLHPSYVNLWKELYAGLPDEEKGIKPEIALGGISRAESVRNGLELIPENEQSYVAVHDAARPLVSEEMISRGWQAAIEAGAAVPYYEMTDSIRELTPEGSKSVDRSHFVRVQTPQVFQTRLLKNAYSKGITPQMTDDASVYEAAGGKVSLYKGEASNIKITNPSDIKIAEILLGK